ncbi:hypothetical protein D3C75_808490 [compost metagenome]
MDTCLSSGSAAGSLPLSVLATRVACEAKGSPTRGESHSQSRASRIQGVKRSHWAMNR